MAQNLVGHGLRDVAFQCLADSQPLPLLGDELQRNAADTGSGHGPEGRGQQEDDTLLSKGGEHHAPIDHTHAQQPAELQQRMDVGIQQHRRKQAEDEDPR